MRGTVKERLRRCACCVDAPAALQLHVKSLRFVERFLRSPAAFLTAPLSSSAMSDSASVPAADVAVPPAASASPAAVDEWSSLRPLLSRRGPFCSSEFDPAEEDPLDIVQTSVRTTQQHTETDRGGWRGGDNSLDRWRHLLCSLS